MFSDEDIYGESYRSANDIMFKLLKSEEEFTADDFYAMARNCEMPPDLIKKLSGSFFRQFQAAGYIEKTDRFKLSERNGSTPLPIWRRTHDD